MGERSINGKSLTEIVAKLREPIPKTAEYWGGKDERGNWAPTWIKGEAYEKIFNDIIGPLNYSREPSPVNIVTLDDKVNATVHMKVTIFDDDGNVVCVKSANGSNETGNGDLKSNYASAETEAFKHLCQDMGIGAGQQDFVSKKDKINGSHTASPAAAERPKPQPQQYSGPLPERGSEAVLTFLEPFGQGQRYRTAKATDAEGRHVLVKIFADKNTLIEEVSGQDIAVFYNAVTTGFSLRCKGEYKVGRDGVLEFVFWGL